MRHRFLAALAIAIVSLGCSAPAAPSIDTAASSSPVARTAAPSTSGGAPSTRPAATPTLAGSAASQKLMTWVPAAPMLSGRHGFDAVVLGDGTLLAVGDDYSCQPGGAVGGSERADLYDPSSDTWTEADGLNKPRKAPATVGLRDGSAMVIGGINSDDYPFSSTKIFSPETREWSDGPLLGLARGEPHTASLGDGRVLVVSDTGSRGRDITSEIYDPRTEAWTRAAPLPQTFSLQRLLALTDDPEDRVIAAGYSHVDSEPMPAMLTYAPERDEWTSIDSPRAFFGYGLAALPGRGALAIGGQEGGELAGGDAVLADVDRLDPETGRWTAVASLAMARIDAQVAVLQDGRVLVVGGATGGDFEARSRVLKSTEIYDPSADRWASGGELLEARKDGLAVVLQDGSVLILGGDASFNTEGETPFCPPPLTSVEHLDPGP